MMEVPCNTHAVTRLLLLQLLHSMYRRIQRLRFRHVNLQDQLQSRIIDEIRICNYIN